MISNSRADRDRWLMVKYKTAELLLYINFF